MNDQDRPLGVAIHGVGQVAYVHASFEDVLKDDEVNSLVDAIRQDGHSDCDIADANQTHELCLAIDQSIAEGGQPVSLTLA